MDSLKVTFTRLLLGISALTLSLSLFLFLVVLDNSTGKSPDKLQINRVDVAMISPPPPPPPITQTHHTSGQSSALNVKGLGGPVKVQYSVKNVMEIPTANKLNLPKISTDKLKFTSHFSANVPMLNVEHLDRVPKVVSQRYVRPPKTVRKYGQKRIETSVELIIDQTGKPFVKRIIDPVFPEMNETIRTWVKHAKFEVPRKEGKAVQAVYLYGINFNYG
ncbi:hypothetical protein [Pseudoalteromonas luteoviolacea]|uniref:hypothetical protein n=1 Tax=Pseudoalteromonas luteoviolacea TaxID=43657 RepID=UPI00114DA2C9|nr:hypothetical protein [Pseudoalteromonas luteoviolacea]TQF70512.1 hypothetical protein FLM44_05305 [Pseudoalteromonas luteoviolacea]